MNLIIGHNNKQVLKPLNHLHYQLIQNSNIITPHPRKIKVVTSLMAIINGL